VNSVRLGEGKNGNSRPEDPDSLLSHKPEGFNTIATFVTIIRIVIGVVILIAIGKAIREKVRNARVPVQQHVARVIARRHEILRTSTNYLTFRLDTGGRLEFGGALI
jgi:hypothetical protein